MFTVFIWNLWQLLFINSCTTVGLKAPGVVREGKPIASLRLFYPNHRGKWRDGIEMRQREVACDSERPKRTARRVLSLCIKVRVSAEEWEEKQDRSTKQGKGEHLFLMDYSIRLFFPVCHIWIMSSPPLPHIQQHSLILSSSRLWPLLGLGWRYRLHSGDKVGGRAFCK